MAIKYLTSLDLRTNELQYASIHPLTTAPTALTPQLGQVYFNTVDDKLKIRTSNGWQTVGGVTSITAGSGIGVTSDPLTGIFTVSHIDTSSISNLVPSTRTYITGLTFDTFGHVTGISTGTETVVDTNTTYSVSVGSGGANTSTIVLTGSDASTDAVTISGTANEIEVTESGDTITIGLPNDVTVSGSLVVGGDLTVNGTVTTVNTETINLADNIILFNSNATGSPTEDAGIEIERGSSANRSLIWNETNDRWELQANDGNYYPIGYVTGADSYVTSIGGATSITVTHNLNTRDVDVQLYDNSTYETVISDVVRTTVNTLTVSFNTAPSANSIRVLVKKIV